MTWGTTDGFLDHFGIEDVRDLPGMEELKAAGLLDSGPAISVYSAAADTTEEAEDTAEEQGTQLELIDNDNGIEDEDPDESETSESLDPDDGEATPL
mgnify:FL=1